MKNTGGSAYPQHVCENCEDPITGNFKGLSIRDYFAGQALAGLLGNGSVESLKLGVPYPESNKNMAMCVYAVADAMLAEREKE